MVDGKMTMHTNASLTERIMYHLMCRVDRGFAVHEVMSSTVDIGYRGGRETEREI